MYQDTFTTLIDLIMLWSIVIRTHKTLVIISEKVMETIREISKSLLYVLFNKMEIIQYTIQVNK